MIFSKPNYTQEYLGAAKQIGFIVGTGRCGTTILAQTLNSHSRICVPHELQIVVSINNGDRLYDKFIAGDFVKYKARDFIHLVETCCPYHFEQFFNFKEHFRKLDFPQTNLRSLLTDLFDHICYTYHKDVFLEQTPWYGQKLEVLKELFPEMKIIHMVRDGRDVANSYARTPWWSNDVNQNLRQWAREIAVIHEYGQNNPQNFLEVRYEDLVLEPVYWLSKILAFFGLDYEERMMDIRNLIDYTQMFKLKKAKKSIAYRQWAKIGQTVFFPESAFVWKEEFSSLKFDLTPEIIYMLRLYNYEV